MSFKYSQWCAFWLILSLITHSLFIHTPSRACSYYSCCWEFVFLVETFCVPCINLLKISHNDCEWSSGPDNCRNNSLLPMMLGTSQVPVAMNNAQFRGLVTAVNSVHVNKTWWIVFNSSSRHPPPTPSGLCLVFLFFSLSLQWWTSCCQIYENSSCRM